MTDNTDPVREAWERLSAMLNAERAPFSNPHGNGLDCEESGYEYLPTMDACMRVYDDDGEPIAVEKAGVLQQCSMNADCRKWETLCHEGREDIATLRTAYEHQAADYAEAVQKIDALQVPTLHYGGHDLKGEWHGDWCVSAGSTFGYGPTPREALDAYLAKCGMTYAEALAHTEARRKLDREARGGTA